LAGTRPAQAGPPADVSGDADPGALIPKLMRRITMGLTSPELASASVLGYQGYLEYQLNATAISDAAVDARLALLTTLAMQPYQLFGLTPGQAANELAEARIVRAVQSRRQLLERMVEFWTDHFNIDINLGFTSVLKTVDDRDVIRANALGSFPLMLMASAQSPAMLWYLNNNTSFAGNPNENYARELMELHTLGVDGGYTQQDVAEVARCFTGWTTYPSIVETYGVLAGTFRFDGGQHDSGEKIVLGNVVPSGGGMQDGMAVLSILANHPSCARYIARKLCKWLVSESPSQFLVNAVAATYTNTGGDIKAMIRTALAPDVLYDAPPKFKRPFHLCTSAIRALGASVVTVNGLRAQLEAAGNQPYSWPSPDGYPDTAMYWTGLPLARWNFGTALATGAISGTTFDAAAWASGLSTADQVVARLDQALFAGEMPAAQKARIRAYLLPDPPTPARIADAIGLAIASPGFQWV
jgi:uncharacterized protein (DUF1800 family)